MTGFAPLTDASSAAGGAVPPIAPPGVQTSAAPEVQLRPMTLARLPAVLAIEQASHPHPWTQGNFLDTLRTGWHAQCLMVDGELLGYFVAMPGVDEAHLLNLTVSPTCRGQGWARVMLDALALWASGLGAGCLWLEVRSGNARAIHIYKQNGYARVGLRKSYYPAQPGSCGEREDAVVMSLKL